MTDATKPPTLTDAEIGREISLVEPPYFTGGEVSRVMKVARAAFALGARRQREENESSERAMIIASDKNESDAYYAGMADQRARDAEIAQAPCRCYGDSYGACCCAKIAAAIEAEEGSK